MWLGENWAGGMWLALVLVVLFMGEGRICMWGATLEETVDLPCRGGLPLHVKVIEALPASELWSRKRLDELMLGFPTAEPTP